jgi:uncharacterized protein YjbJ (UPF0337 family)
MEILFASVRLVAAVAAGYFNSGGGEPGACLKCSAWAVLALRLLRSIGRISDVPCLPDPTEFERAVGKHGMDERVGRMPAVARRSLMGINKDQVEGRAKEAAGKVQEVAGKAVGSTTQQVKGAVNHAAGAAQAKYGDVKSEMNKDSKQTK